MKQQIGNMYLDHIKETNLIGIWDSNGMFVGNVTEKQILKLAEGNELW